MSQGKARAMLSQAVSHARHEMWEEYEELMEANEEAREGSFWGGLGGSLLLPIVVNALVPGAGLVAMSLMSGAGSRIFSEVGEHMATPGGVQEEFDAGVGYGSADLGRQLEQNVSDAWGGFGTKQWGDAARATATAFIAGGGLKAAKSAFAAKPGLQFPTSGIGPPAQVPGVSPGIVGGLKNIMQAPYKFDPLQFMWSKYLETGGSYTPYPGQDSEDYNV